MTLWLVRGYYQRASRSYMTDLAYRRVKAATLPAAFQRAAVEAKAQLPPRAVIRSMTLTLEALKGGDRG